MRKKLDENDLVLKWPAPFREGVKITAHDLRTLDVMIHGETEITAKGLEEMKKFGYIFDGIRVSTYVDKSLKGNLNIQDEDDFSPFLLTLVAFRRYQAPPLENGGKSDKKVLKKTKPQQTGSGVPSHKSVRSGKNHGGDISQ
jgi:hypothetical protein